MERKFIIGERLLMQLLESDAKLEELEAAGVDNWGGYDEIDFISVDPGDYAADALKYFLECGDVEEVKND